MKAFRYLTPFIILLLLLLPLLVGAQEIDEDIFVPLPPAASDELTEDDIPSVPVDNTITLPNGEVVGPAVPPTEELIEYPSPGECYDSDPDDLIVPICPPTVTPTSQPTAISTPLPGIVNGLWVMQPNSGSFSTVGDCLKPAGLGQGDGLASEADLPKVPACMSGDHQWLTMNADTVALIAPGVYSQSRTSREVITDISGTTTGTVNVTIRREYHIISPTEIEVFYFWEEEGGCSMTTSVKYVLYEPNELVCTGEFITPQVTATPLPTTTPLPGEIAQPPVTPEPPVQVGDYRIVLPPPDPTCTAETLPPSDRLKVSYTANQDMFIDFGGSSYTLYWDGGTSYQFMEKALFQITLFANPGRISFTWVKTLSAMSPPCYIQTELVSADTPLPTATPTAVEPTLVPAGDAAQDTAGGDTYTTVASVSQQICPIADTLPDLNAATLTAQADGSYLFTFGGETYVLTSESGMYVYRDMSPDGSMLQIGLNGFFQGQGSGTFYLMEAGGGQCMAMLTFNPA